ncbi:MAG TPA: cellulose biosynthesis protein BcsS [Pseudolabrys sp.]|nr:cellulose biosynthesis protein BcsS [Pseudolabrys sp.]
MGSVRCVRAVAIATAIALVCCVGVSAEPARSGDGDARFLLFSGADVWRDGQFGHSGLLWSPYGLDRDGFTLKAMISGGRYRYISGALNNTWVIGTEEEAQALPGWRFKGDLFEVKIFAGLDVTHGATWPDDPDNRLRGTHLGLRTAVDVWYEPTSSTMLATDASLTTIAADYSARIAYGWRLNDWFYLGPEAQAFACDGYRQFRFGVHLTALKTGTWEWSAAAGWTDDSNRRTGPYLRFGLLTRR